MIKNKFMTLVAILSQLTGISAKADTSKISSDSVKTSESKKAKMNKQEKKKLENQGYKNLYPYGLWGLHEILSLCGGDSWWKYPSYLSVLKNCGRLFSNEEDESMEIQLKKMEQQAAELKKQADKQEADKIKEKFGQDVNVEEIRGKIKKIQKHAKKIHEKILNLKNKKATKIQSLFRRFKAKRELLKFDDNDLTISKSLGVFGISRAGYILPLKAKHRPGFDKFILKENIVDKLNIDTKKMIDDFKAKDDPENLDSQDGIYGVVSVDDNIMVNVLSLIGEDNVDINFIGKYNFKERSEGVKKLIECLERKELQFFIVFGTGVRSSGLDAHLVCCRKFSWTENFIRSEAEKMKMLDVEKFLKLFIPYSADCDTILLSYCIEKYPDEEN